MGRVAKGVRGRDCSDFMIPPGFEGFAAMSMALQAG